MSENERKELGLLILSTATYYGRQIDKQVLTMMIDDLADLDFDMVCNSYANYRKTPKNKTFPLPSDIRELALPNFSNESIGRDTSARIIAAIPHYGYNNGLLAKDYIGEFGWELVKRLGGWAFLCQNLGVSINNSALSAQIRELATDQSKYGATAIKEKVDNLHLEQKHNNKSIIKLLNMKKVQ